MGRPRSGSGKQAGRRGKSSLIIVAPDRPASVGVRSSTWPGPAAKLGLQTSAKAESVAGRRANGRVGAHGEVVQRYRRRLTARPAGRRGRCRCCRRRSVERLYSVQPVRSAIAADRANGPTGRQVFYGSSQAERRAVLAVQPIGFPTAPPSRGGVRGRRRRAGQRTGVDAAKVERLAGDPGSSQAAMRNDGGSGLVWRQRPVRQPGPAGTRVALNRRRRRPSRTWRR